MSVSEDRKYKCACGKKMLIPAEMAAKALKCPRCGKRVAAVSPALDLSDHDADDSRHDEEENPRPRPSSQKLGADGARKEKPAGATRSRDSEDKRPRSSPGSERAMRALDAVRASTRKPASESSADEASGERDELELSGPKKRVTTRRRLRETAGAPPEESKKRAKSKELGKSRRTDSEAPRERQGVGGARLMESKARRPVASSRRSPAAESGPPARPGLLPVLGLAGTTIEILLGGTILVAALASPTFLAPAGFSVTEGTKWIVAGFGALFGLAGLLGEFALFGWLRAARRLEAAAGAGNSAGDGRPRDRDRSRRADEESRADDVDDAAFEAADEAADGDAESDEDEDEDED